MKSILVIITMGLFSILGCGQNSNLKKVESKPSQDEKLSLTKEEMELLKKINFNPELLAEVKDITKKEMRQLPAIDQETGDILTDKVFDGIYFETTDENVKDIVKKYKPKFRENGYLIFLFEGEDYKDKVAVIKGTDDLDILKYRRTDGINYGLENEDVVKKIFEWKAKYGLNVIGCGRDYLDIEFDNLPSNIDQFAKEVYEFCPDTVDQGVGTIEKLKLAIKQMNGVSLWWD